MTSTIPVVEDMSLKSKDPVPGQLCAGGGYGEEVDPAAIKGNRTTSSANYESSPSQILTSLQTVLSVSLLGSETGGPPGIISYP